LVHELGSRRDAPYLRIDCASLPQELVESELFGHERGAFTGAVERKLGRLELAGGGTIVLDEVAALAPSIQSKLLRVLEERGRERLGGTETLGIEARLVALTNADLAKAVATGRFREDLYFRLNVLTLTVPPLRERPADILPLAEHLLARLAPVHGRPDALLGDEAQRMLLAYAWPGNVRELKNVIERALIFAKGSAIGPEDFPESVRAVSSGAVAGCARSKKSSAKPFRPRWRPRAIRFPRPLKSWVSAGKPCSISARNTAWIDAEAEAGTGPRSHDRACATRVGSGHEPAVELFAPVPLCAVIPNPPRRVRNLSERFLDPAESTGLEMTSNPGSSRMA